MYKGGILNGELNRVLGNMRHTDRICIGDCGLPIPKGVEVVDLAVKLGSPSFLEVLDVIMEHFEAEKVTAASEIVENNASLYEELRERFSEIPIELIPHKEFKELTASCAAIVRTGENHPYANIIIQSACIF